MSINIAPIAFERGNTNCGHAPAEVSFNRWTLVRPEIDATLLANSFKEVSKFPCFFTGVKGNEATEEIGQQRSNCIQISGYIDCRGRKCDGGSGEGRGA